MAKWTYRATGFPWARYSLTIGFMLIVYQVIMHLLPVRVCPEQSTCPEPGEFEISLLSGVVGSMVTAFSMAAGWWFKEQSERNGNGNGQGPPESPPAASGKATETQDPNREIERLNRELNTGR